MKIAAHLGYLWADRPVAEAIPLAAAAGFAGFELHAPYDQDQAEIRAALIDAGLPMLGVNTRRSLDPEDRETVGLAALPGREHEAQDAILEAIDWARALGAAHIHVLAGKTSGPEAAATFDANLLWACGQAAKAGVGLVLEPLNTIDNPGYFLSTTTHAEEIIRRLGRPELGLMFDTYHVQVMEGDVIRRFGRLLPLIRHVQFASTPGRLRPDLGDLAHERVLPAMRAAGYDGLFGAEYRTGPVTGPDTEKTLGWFDAWRAAGIG